MEKMQQESRESGASSSLSAVSPSFNSYSSENIADIAARVVHELNLSQYDDYFYSSLQQNYALHSVDDQNQNDAVEADNDDINNDGDDVEDDDDDDSEFEFAVFAGEDTSSPISADEIFYNGQIKPIYPVFDTNLIFGYQNVAVSPVSRQSKTTSDNSNRTAPLRVPLRKLMSEERESRRNGSVSSTSSSEDGGELEGVPPGTYCVWAPKKKLSSEENGGAEEEDMVTMKKKSNSTGAGSSKRWRFRDLIHRSNSDGKDTFVFLTPTHNHHHNNNHGKNQNGGEMKRREKVTAVNNSSIYGKKRAGEEEKKKKKSYLPYKQDLVGFFSNVNGLNRSIRPF